MDKWDCTCLICKRTFKIERYDSGRCPYCLQEYNYEEMVQIVLTEEQLDLLRKQKGII